MSIKRRRDADVSMSTMILFTAIMIAAVISASSFIYQANRLGQQAERTASQAQTDRAARLQVIAIYGDRRGITADASQTFESWTDADGSAGLKGADNITIVITNKVVSQTLWINVTTNSSVSGGAATFGLNGSVQGDLGGGIVSGTDDNWGNWYSFDNGNIMIRIQGPGPAADNYWYNGSGTGNPDRWVFTITAATWDNRDHIVNTYLKVELAPGSPAIDMNDTIIELSNGSVHRTLSLGSTANNTHYSASALRDPDGLWSTDNIVSQGTVLEIRINGTDSTDVNMTTYWLTFSVQEDLSGKIVPKHGYPTYFKFKAPDIFKDRYIDLY